MSVRGGVAKKQKKCYSYPRCAVIFVFGFSAQFVTIEFATGISLWVG